MKYIEAPNEYFPNSLETSIFLAGGITDCPNWQLELVELLKETNLVIFNPRRKDFHPSKQENIRQIEWEFRYLQKATAISFWFSEGSLQPIAMFEYGKWLRNFFSKQGKPLFVGIHPEFKRKFDIELQTNLEFVPYTASREAANLPHHSLFYNDLCPLARAIKDWVLGREAYLELSSLFRTLVLHKED